MISILKPLVLVFPFVALIAGNPGSMRTLPKEATISTVARGYAPKYNRPASIPFPSDNAYTKEREHLGKVLFFDPRLSGSNWISCASCHNPALSWGDGLPKAIGHGMKELGRRTPTILNLAWSESLFWDGRAASLEEQALGPVSSPGEMNLELDKMVEKIKAVKEYHQLFERAYPGEPISEKTIAKAIATYERGIVSGKAPFDKWLAGDERALDESAKRGFVLFNEKANCVKCHTGWRFTDDGFHDVGIAGEDPGRGKLLPDIPAMQSAFKTPGLRNVDRRAPYFHNGSAPTLEAVVEYYNKGGEVKRASLSPDVKPLQLTALEKRDLVAFLTALTSVDAPCEIPSLPR